MSVVQPTNSSSGIVVHTRNCTECDFYISGTDKCKKHGHVRSSCLDGRKVLKSLGGAKK